MYFGSEPLLQGWEWKEGLFFLNGDSNFKQTVLLN